MTDNLPFLITKALGYSENGGKPNINAPSKGKTGEMKSIFQYTPDTWKIYSKQITGKDNLPLTSDNETAVTLGKVTGWVNTLRQQGVSDQEIPLKIASMWNAGEHKPDAYKQNWKGLNKKYGVAYDTPAYANKVASYVKQFQKEGVQPSQSNELAIQNNTQTTKTPASTGLMQNNSQVASAAPDKSGNIRGLLSSLLPPV